MIRQILGVIGGYLIFVISSLLFFKISGIDPHSNTSAIFMVLIAIYGAVFSSIRGLTTLFIAKRKTISVNYALAFVLAGFAAFSYFKATGEHWTQIIAIFIFAPISILDGLIYLRRKLR